MTNEPPPPPDATPEPRSEAVEPMGENPGLAATFEALLKRPLSLLDALLRPEVSSAKIVTNLLLTSAFCLVAFGLVVGSHAMGTQLWAAPLKITAGMLVAGLICLPSLYIFSCLNGLDVRISSVTGVLFTAICMISLLLLGFAPVVWIFSQSTNSVAFMGALALVFWLVAAGFGLGFIIKTAAHLGVKKRFHLGVWIAIFVVVSLQMTTSLRPIVGNSERFINTEKKFFLTHWSDQFRAELQRPAPQRAPKEAIPPSS